MIGTPSSDPTGDLSTAYQYLDAIHLQSCGNSAVRILFKRLPTFGVSNDLNSIVRSLAVAIRDRRQLVLLPPSAKNRAKVRKIAGELSIRRPWHWLGAGIPLASLIYPSACQQELERSSSVSMDALGANGSDAERLVPLLGLASLSGRCRDYDARNRWNLDLAPRVIPERFRTNGMLWWLQVLTTYLIRLRPPLADLLNQHPAMREYSQRTGVRARTFLIGPTKSETRIPYLYDDAHPAFDVGLHIRVGDACGVRAPRSAFRRCIRSLSGALEILTSQGVRGGSVFIASDSPSIVEQVRLILHSSFNMSFIRLDRRKYERHDKLVEISLQRNGSGTLLEALIDLLLLSRARLVAGSMLGNMPRLALQLRVQPPASTRQPYVSLDGHRWCTTSSCKPYFQVRPNGSASTDQSRRRVSTRNKTRAAWQGHAHLKQRKSSSLLRRSAVHRS